MALPRGAVSDLQALGNGQAVFEVDGSAIWVTDGSAAGTRALGAGTSLTYLRPGVAAAVVPVANQAPLLTTSPGLGVIEGNAVVPSSSFSLRYRELFNGQAIGISDSNTIQGDLISQGDGSATFTLRKVQTLPFFGASYFASTAAFAPAASPSGTSLWALPNHQGQLNFVASSFEAVARNFIFPNALSGIGTPNTKSLSNVTGWVRLNSDSAIVAYEFRDFEPGIGFRGIEPGLLTLSGVVPLGNLNPFTGSNPESLANLGGNRVVFTAEAGDGRGREPWITDGTPAGTLFLGDLYPFAPGSEAAGFTATTGGRFVFGANDGVAGRELWVSDGTPGGTRLLADLLPGAAGSNPQNFVALGDGRVAFTTSAGLWVTDGTAAGTAAFGAGLVASNLAATRIFDGVNTTASPLGIIGPPISGTARDDALRGTAFNDTFFWSAGDDVMDGFAGVDNVSYREFNLRAWTPSYTPTDGLRLSRQGESDLLISINRASFIDGELVFDAEAPIAVVTRLYQAALGRGPDQVALNQGTAALQQGIDTANAPVKRGLTTNELAARIVASADFQAVHGASQTNTEFVSGLYTLGLGRAADTTGLNFWIGFLAGGGSRAEVLTGFAQSAEMRTNTATQLSTGLWDVDKASAQVARLYLAALDRVPELPGFLDSRNYLFSAPPTGLPGPSLQGLADIMLRGVEFNGRPAGDDTAFVTRIYNQALDRAPEAEGLAFWTGAMRAGLSRAEVLLGISESAEHQALSARYVMPEASPGIVFA